MISFFCSLCGMKFQLKDEFAGRSSRCPTCKQSLIVPTPDKTEVPKGEIEGSASSLVQAGMDGGVTLEQAAGPGQKPLRQLLASPKRGQRYIVENEIARGGMGAILRAVDCDIRREVAVKYLLDQSDPRKKVRFVEEAQITGQLEHPNIVPIHELGVDNLKRLFFSMKMVKGRSLAQVLDELRQKPKTGEKAYPLSRLLNIFVNICNALAYAHSCGVVHRDLKPANIMIGDFGEVYVMDWGLAKLLKEGQAIEAPMATLVGGGSITAPMAIPASPTISAKRPPKVETNREAEADLTQDGAVLGTPVYMPPEQAAGHVQAIDQRSDIYSLGAILYEMLALQPPINKEGGYLAILMRVAEGEIVPLTQRPGTGKIPKELSAIAMKALAKNPNDRYPSVEALRQDIERFQEGRSVSAKEDTFRETAWKLVKRNKGLSTGVAVALLVLLCSTGFLLKAWWETSRAKTALEQAQKEKDYQTKQAIPAFVRSARLLGGDGSFGEAIQQVEVALAYDHDHADARLLRGQLLVAKKDWVAGRAELERYLRLRPDDVDARKLLDLCATGKANDPVVLFALAEVLQRQKVFGLAFHLLGDFSRSLEASKSLQALYRKQIEAAWPGLGNRLRLERNGQFRLNLHNCKQVADLHPLKGMQLHVLRLQGCDRIADLSPLRGMPLTSLDLGGCGLVSDLTPFQGMPLTTLHLNGCGRVRELTPLKGLPLTVLSLANCGQVSDLKPLQGLPLNTLSLNSCGQLSDLTGLQGLRLTSLDLTHCDKVRDLTPLKGLPLTGLNLEACVQLKDLTPLQGLRLKWLNLLTCTQVRDLTPLQGLELAEVMLNPKTITKGMGVLRQMKSLKTIGIGWEAKDRFPAGEFWKKYGAAEFSK